jgi:secreted trypsin-like serine protease
MRRSVISLIGLIGAMLLAGCGGGSGTAASPSPSTPTAAPSIDACGVIGATSIVNGASCSTATSRVALLSMRMRNGDRVGACSGTIIAPRAILTAAHCLKGETEVVLVWFGAGSDLVEAASFLIHPNYRGTTTTTEPDVGIVFMKEDLARAPVPVLVSRAARPGEQAVIAGWGNDQNQVADTNRAGVTTLSAVGPLYLETQYTTTSSSICGGDSGGPLLLQQDGVWSVAAVNSAASTASCTLGTNFYVSVFNNSIRTFILEQVPGAATR